MKKLSINEAVKEEKVIEEGTEVKESKVKAALNKGWNFIGQHKKKLAFGAGLLGGALIMKKLFGNKNADDDDCEDDVCEDDIIEAEHVEEIRELSEI